MTTRKRSVLAGLCVLLLCAWVQACGGDNVGGDDPDGSLDAGPGSGDASSLSVDGGGNGYVLEIWVEGDLTPKTFTDGWSGQTPTNYVMGLSRYDLMRSADDPDPVTVFDHGQTTVECDMLGRTLAGTADLDAIQPGAYPYSRVLLTMSRFDVETDLHVTSPSATLPGTLTVTAALSDTILDSVARDKGWVEYSFDLMGGIATQGQLPPLPSTAGGTVVEESDRTWLIFPISPPAVIEPQPTRDRSATIIYEVYESFRWEDLRTAGYSAGRFDTEDSGTSEPVCNFGATAYRIVFD